MTQSNDLSVLNFAGVKLAFPLKEVSGVQRISRLESDSDSELPLAFGSLVHNGRRWPVFGMANNLSLLSSLSKQFLYCVCLSADNDETGLALACESVNTVVLGPGVSTQPLPEYMRPTHSPLHHWVKLDHSVVTISNVLAMAQYIKRLIEVKES